MREFISDNALKIFIGGLFVIAIGITVLLHSYANQMQKSLNDVTAPGTVVSDTTSGDYTINEVQVGN